MAMIVRKIIIFAGLFASFSAMGEESSALAPSPVHTPAVIPLEGVSDESDSPAETPGTFVLNRAAPVSSEKAK